MIAHELKLSEKLLEQWGWPERDEIKRRLGSLLPDDAVIALPERDPLSRTYVYSVLSDDFDEARWDVWVKGDSY